MAKQETRTKKYFAFEKLYENFEKIESLNCLFPHFGPIFLGFLFLLKYIPWKIAAVCSGNFSDLGVNWYTYFDQHVITIVWCLQISSVMPYLVRRNISPPPKWGSCNRLLVGAFSLWFPALYACNGHQYASPNATMGYRMFALYSRFKHTRQHWS